MKKIFTKITAVLCMATIGLSAIGCGGKINTGENCLDVYVHKAGYGVEWCEELLKEFVTLDWVKEKYPDVKYTFASTDQDGYVKSKIVASNNNHFDLMLGFNGDAPSNYDLLEDITQGVYKQKVPDLDKPESEWITYEDKVYDSYNEVNKYIQSAADTENAKYYTTSWAGGMNGFFYNEDILTQNGCSVPRTTDELIAVCEKIEGYDFIQAQGLAYWLYILPIWWAQYEGVSGYYDYYNGMYYGSVSKDIFNQKGRLEALKLFEELLSYGKYLDPFSMSESAKFKVVQSQFLKGATVFHVNGDWFENEMKKDKENIKNNEGIDYSIKLMRTPIISALGTKLGITDAKLAEIVDYVDGVTTQKPDVNDTIIEKVREARGVVHSIGSGHMSFVPSYAQDKDIAQDFLLFMATDRAQEIYMQKTGGASLPFDYDVKTKNPTLYNSLSEMQKERIDYFNSDTVKVTVLPAPEAFPLVRYGGLREFSITDYQTVLSMNNPSKTAQQIFDDTISYWHDQRWDSALSKAGIVK